MSTPIGAEESIFIPPEVNAKKEVAIFYTGFDEDGFLEFRGLAGEADRNGLSAAFYQAARKAYRALWKEEFAQISYSGLRPEFGVPEGGPVHNQGLREIVLATEKGKQLLEKLVSLVDDPRSSVQLLKEVNSEIQKIDSKIEELGLSYPFLGALIRIFLMEKENLRGDDVRLLASDTRGLYDRLARRAVRLGRLFSHFGGRSSAVLPIISEKAWAGAGGF